MDINYKILWFEDTDESYETLSRRTERYVQSKNLRCQIKRIYGVSDFDISQYDLNSFEVLVVDLQLSQGSKGYEIIEAIRASNYVNDILFYSSAGVNTLEKAMKEYKLEGVFLSDRDNRIFMEKIKQLIDKSVRRSGGGGSSSAGLNLINGYGNRDENVSMLDASYRGVMQTISTLLAQGKTERAYDEAVNARSQMSKQQWNNLANLIWERTGQKIDSGVSYKQAKVSKSRK